jgi:hypothetical protein
MRKISLTLVAAMLLFTGSVFGNGSDKGDPSKELRKQVKELLGDYRSESNRNLVAGILFIINRDNEIVVLSVETNNSNFKEYIKTRLNYKEAKTEESVGDKRFVIQVRVLRW